jgi:predicted DNA-binding protein YlxM (UPF0122 family)
VGSHSNAFVAITRQATVKHRFSVNKDVSVDNISEHNIVARRRIKDHIHGVGGVMNVIVNKDMLNSMQNARKLYQAYLEMNCQEQTRKEKGERRKRLEEKLVVLRKKRKTVQDDIDVLTGSLQIRLK